jgi:ribosomal protein L16/L10AE
MRKRYILLIMGSALVVLFMPSVVLRTIQQTSGTKEAPPPVGLVEREAKYRNEKLTRTARVTKNYLEATKAAINRELKESGRSDHEASQIVFTSEKVKRIAGQKQVHLTFTYQLQPKKGKPKKLNGSIHLATDEAGNLFDTSIKI